MIWLEGWLKKYPGTLLLISHDRDFLDQTIDHVVHMEQQTASLYSGNYSAFEQIRAARLANQQAEHQRQQREIAHIRSYVDRFRAKATKARQAQSRLKALARMELIAPAHVDSQFHFAFRAPQHNPHPLLQLEKVNAGYNQQPLLQKIGLSLEPGDRIGLLGPNGAGKSTLIKLMAGELTPLAGKLLPAQELKIGYFAQHQLEQLNLHASPLQHLQRLDAKASEPVSCGIFSADLALPVSAHWSRSHPSPAAKRRAWCWHYWSTNAPTCCCSTSPLTTSIWRCATPSARRCRILRGRWCWSPTTVTCCASPATASGWCTAGASNPSMTTLEAYPAWLTAQRREQGSDGNSRSEGEHTAEARRARKRAEAERRRQLQPLKRQMTKLEQEMERLQASQSILESSLADTGFYQEDRKQDLKQLLAEKAEVDRQLQAIETDWFAIGEQLEAAQLEETD